MNAIKQLVALALVAALTGFAFASDELDMYIWLFETAYSVEERFALIEECAISGIPDAEDLYARALEILLTELPRLKTTSERDTADIMASRLAGLLGNEDGKKAAADLWRVYRLFSNPTVKADALVALGRIRAPDQLGEIVRLLEELNIEPGIDPDSSETIACGAIKALEKYGDRSGFIPLFFASVAWYSERTKKLAATTLDAIADDPTTWLQPVISGAAPEIKQTALERIDASAAPSSAKADSALFALNEGRRNIAYDATGRLKLGQLRKTALSMLMRYGSEASAVGSLITSYYSGIDFEEKTLALGGLAKNDNAAAADALTAILSELNGKREYGAVTADDERLIRAVIQSAGVNGHPSLAKALQDVRLVGWTNVVNLMSGEAIKKLRR